MRHARGSLVVAVTLLLGLVVALSLPPGTTAQDATPAPAERMEIAPGVTLAASGEAGPGDLRLFLDPGAVFPIDPGGGLELVYVEQGEITLRLDGPVIVGPLGGIDAGGTVVPAGTTVTLTAGQYFVLEPQLAGELRAAGSAPVTVAVASLPPASQDDATPAG